MAGTTYASRPASNLITKCLFPHPSAGAYSALPIKREWDVLPCTVPFSFFCPVPPMHPGLSRNFWLQYTPNLAPTIEKLPERTVCVQSREFLDGWNNLCIPACLKFNYKMFIPTSLGRRLFGPAHKKEDGTYYHVQSHSLFSVQYHLRIPAYRKVLKIKIGLKTELKDWGRSANIQKNRHQTSAREHQRAFSGSNR